jgi:hypothetical protein
MNIIDSPDDEHRGARNIWRIGMNIYKKNCASIWLLESSSIQTCSLDGHLHIVIYKRYINTIDSPDDEHRGARNMYRISINIYENNCASS